MIFRQIRVIESATIAVPETNVALEFYDGECRQRAGNGASKDRRAIDDKYSVIRIVIHDKVLIPPVEGLVALGGIITAWSTT